MTASGLVDLLRSRLRAEGQPPDAPLSIAELHRRLLPYHVCRRELGFATKAEYDVALLELLVGGGEVRLDEPEFAEAVRRELASPEPGLAVLQRFAASEIRLASGAPEGREGAAPASADGEDSGGGALVGVEAPGEGGAGVGVGAASGVRRSAGPAAIDESLTPATAGGPADGPDQACWQCGRSLPSRLGLRFCPQCGRDQSVRECAGCGAEVEIRWSYCVMCGEKQPPRG